MSTNDANEDLNLTTEQVLDQRGSRYGSFDNHAAISQALKNGIMQHYFNTHGGPDANPLPPYMIEAISMISHKLGRIANGDPYYIDSWRDLGAYAELVVKELQSTEGATDSKVDVITYKNGAWS